MKAILFTDTHYSPIKGMELFANTTLSCMHKIMDYAEKQNIEYLWNLGDTFHTKDFIESYLLPKATPTFERFKNFKTTFIVGNHDLVMKEESTYCLLEMFKEYIEIVKDPYIVKEIDGNRFVFCNYAGNSYIANEAIPVEHGKKNVLLGHFDCNGFYTNATYEMKDAEVDAENLNMFDRVFVGHYHKRSKRHNIQYIGSTHHQKRNDVGNPHGFMVLDLKTLEYAFKTFDDYTPPCFYEFNLSEMKDIKKVKNGFVKINISEEEDRAVSNSLLHNLRKKLERENGNHSVSFSYKKNAEEVEVLDEDSLVDELSGIDTANIEDIFHPYVESVDTELNKKQLVRLIKT